MPGTHPSVASHWLNVMPSSRPVRQKFRRFHLDRQKIIQADVDKLLAAGFIEVEYLDWLMTKIFKPLIGHIVEVYIDDIVVKRRTKSEDARHLEENFRLMKAYNMKLNPTKCAFVVSIGKFLRFLVTQRGIEVNPDQIKAIMETFP
ncbi:hypothetical protein CK203_036954 [Vitis vinifera]|uniref:Reverse transcriptase domain-containing protein n=2 Tax=Vitis vinifera TaxID=29760 RepID=A5C2H6_VITVI|nr:hypothetical protein CK203_036954 [Vitis vinifera]CAN68570.1 hypothetical protein VITISV_023883 [Vitis vinifera]